MDGLNRALKGDIANAIQKALREFDYKSNEIPCVFVSYQRDDETFATEVAEYIMSLQIDVYFDLQDNDLKQFNQTNNPQGVTLALTKGLNNSQYMIVIVSPNTYQSVWVPFEIGYAYDKKGDNLKLLRHKGLSKSTLPSYLKVKEMLDGTISLNRFLTTIRKQYSIYERLIRKGEEVKSFREHNKNPLSKYLDSE